MRIHDRYKISFSNDTTKQAVQRLNMLLEDIKITREFVSADQFREEIFLSPGAYCKLVNAEGLPEGTELKKEDEDFVGKIGDIPARSPMFVHPHYRDLEGLGDMQLEYRVIGD